MALLTFPASPVNNQLYPVTPVIGQNQYRYDSATSTWVLEGAATAVIPGTYGSGTEVAQFTVDTQGRLTFAQNVPIAGVAPQDLQDVTDIGAVTTNVIDVAGLVAAGLSYPSADGAAGDVLVTDGAGTLSFVAAASQDLQTVTDNGNTTTNRMRFYDSVTTNEAVRIDPDNGTIEIFPQSVGNSGLILSPTAVSFGNSIGSIGATGLVPSSIEFDGSAGVRVNSGLGTAPVEMCPGGAATVSTDSSATTISNQLVASGLSYPTTDGTADQVLATDGAGVLGWLSTVRVVAVPSASTDPGNLGEVAVGAGFFYFFDGGQWLKVAGVPV